MLSPYKRLLSSSVSRRNVRRGAGRRRSSFAVAVAVVMALSACGSSNDPTSNSNKPTSDSNKLTSVSVGAVPIIDVAPLYLGVHEGIFKRHGLDVKVQVSQGGSAIIPAVLNGELQFGNSNSLSLLIAASKGLDLSLIAAGSGSTDDPASDASTVVVPARSAINRLGDLGSKRVAINSINNIIDVVVREAVRADGGDPGSVKFVEIPFPEMPAAVSGGQVDAAYVTEPFATIAQQQGAKKLPSPAASAFDRLQLTQYFTSAQFANKSPQTVKAFVDAMVESQRFASDNPDRVRNIITTYTQIKPSLASKLILPAYPTSVNMQSLKRLAELAKVDGLVSSEIPFDKLVRK